MRTNRFTQNVLLTLRLSLAVRFTEDDEVISDVGQLRDGTSGSYTSMPTSTCKRSDQSKCQDLVWQAMTASNESKKNCFGNGSLDPGDCIGDVLLDARNHSAECCEKGTEFDDFLLGVPALRKPITSKTFKAEDFGENSAVLIIDVQKDFTVGSFGQPCWSSGGDGFVDGIIEFANLASSSSATIIASKDFHPSTHCSFLGESHCMNIKGYDAKTAKDVRKKLKHVDQRYVNQLRNSQADVKLGAKLEHAEQRYVNLFPSHCTFDGYTEEDDGKKYAKPQKGGETPFCHSVFGDNPAATAPATHFCADTSFKGTDFDPKLEEALTKIEKQNPNSVEVVYKGFHPDFDSFSAMPHLQGFKTDCPRCPLFTGSYAIESQRARNCTGKWSKEPKCFPTEDELKNPGVNMRSITSILNNKSITKLYVVGLVYDFCVKETALFAREAAEVKIENMMEDDNETVKAIRDLYWKDWGWNAGANAEVTVVGTLTRPSFDGKPGFPYAAGACDGNTSRKDGKMEGLCTTGAGLPDVFVSVKNEFDDNNVTLVRQAC